MNANFFWSKGWRTPEDHVRTCSISISIQFLFEIQGKSRLFPNRFERVPAQPLKRKRKALGMEGARYVLVRSYSGCPDENAGQGPRGRSTDLGALRDRVTAQKILKAARETCAAFFARALLELGQPAQRCQVIRDPDQNALWRVQFRGGFGQDARQGSPVGRAEGSRREGLAHRFSCM